MVSIVRDSKRSSSRPASVQVLVTRAVLDDLLNQEAGSLLSDNWPVLLLLVGITTALSLAATIQTTLNLVTIEAVGLRAVSVVLDPNRPETDVSQVSDSDLDGVPDDVDQFPADPTRS